MRIHAILFITSLFALSTVNGYAQEAFATLHIKSTGAGGKPLLGKLIRVIGENTRQEYAGPDEQFSFILPKAGVYTLVTRGINHRPVVLPVVIEKPGPLSIEVQLPPVLFLQKPDSLFITGDFNNFSLEKGLIPLLRSTDGRYRATVALASDTLAYHVLGACYTFNPRGTRSDGTDGIRYIYQNQSREPNGASTKFITVVKVKDGKTTVVYDPALLPPSNNLKAVIRFDSQHTRTGNIAEAFLDYSHREFLLIKKAIQHRLSGGNPDSFFRDQTKDEAELIALYQKEQDPLVRECRLLLYLNFMGDKINPALARRMLDEISPASSVWAIDPGEFAYAFNWASKALGNPKEADDYVRKIVKAHKRPDVLPPFLNYGFYRAKETGNQSLAEYYYNRLSTEFPNSPLTQQAKKYTQDGKLGKGKEVPPFRLTALGDDKTTYTPESLKGKVYLMDFWATWCPPCVGALPNITQVYEEFKDKGFSVLSLSLNKTPEEVEAFRKKRFAMPWMHTLLAEGYEHLVAKEFMVTALPRATLVDQHGKIIANDAELEGDGLRRILTSLLNEKKDGK